MLICCCTAAGAQMYSCGGIATVGAAPSNITDKTDMSAETTAAKTTANLSQSRGAAGGFSNPSVAAYLLGGSTRNIGGNYIGVITADKLTFSSDVTAAKTTANLTVAKTRMGSISERSTKGYVAGGYTDEVTGTLANAVANKTVFSTDTTSAQASANLSQSRGSLIGMTEGSSKGYFAGGTTSLLAADRVVTADKITFSSDTTAAQTTANLSQAREGLGGASDGSTKGYWAGGLAPTVVSTVDKITFSTDTTAALTSATVLRAQMASGSDGNKAMFLGGYTNTPSGDGLAGNKIVFSTDVSSTLAASANLSSARFAPAGVTTVAL